MQQSSFQASPDPAEIDRLLLERFSRSGIKRLLALEAGRPAELQALVYGLGILEQHLQRRTRNPDLRLCDAFDLISGTGFAAWVSSLLALGLPVAEIEDVFFQDLKFAERQPFFPPQQNAVQQTIAVAEPEFPVKDFLAEAAKHPAFEPALRTAFADNAWKTGHSLLLRGPDGVPILLHNHPKARGTKELCDMPLGMIWELTQPLVGAAVAPTKASAVYGSGSSALFGNPELPLFIAATDPDYPFRWPVGAEQLEVWSVGPAPAGNRTPAFLASSTPVQQQIRQQEARLARWWFDGESQGGYHTDLRPPLGFAPARHTRFFIENQNIFGTSNPEQLRSAAAKAFESLDLSGFVSQTHAS